MGLLPAVVAPGDELPGARLARYARQMLLPGFGDIAQRRLAHARVLVIGAGGLGSASIPYLASSGVGTIGVVDDDVVELSNLHRQVVHGVADIGRPKTASMADAVAAIDPEVRLVRHDVRLTSATLPGILAEYDLVLDGSDNFATRYLCNDATVLAHKPLVWGAILRFGGQVSVSWGDAGPTYRDLYPDPPAPGEVPNCAEAGVIPGVCAVIGAQMATEALKLITGIGEPLIGRVSTYDALTGRFREIAYARDPEADAVTGLIDYDAFCGAPAPAAPPAAAASAAPSPATAPAATAPAASAPTESAESPASAPAAPSASAAPTAPAPASAPVPDERARRSGDPRPQREPSGALAESMDVHELAARMERGEALQLIDVREPVEASIARVPGSELIPLAELPARLEGIRTDVPVVLYCHLGMRSQQAATYLRRAGYDNVIDLTGGIDAYAAEIDTTMARY